MDKKSNIAIILIFTFLLSACAKEPEISKNDANMPEIYIECTPSAADFARMTKFAGTKTLPERDKNETWGIDIRSSDISDDNVMDRYDDLLYTDFDSKTKWPKKLPNGFNPEKVMELYKDPGLNIRELHKKGITGKGVGIAILDQNLLVDHIEYKEQLRFYEEDDEYKEAASGMHGPAVASIAVGKTVGVAPEADLYYIASSFGEFTDDGFIYDYTSVAENINRVIEINKDLPEDRKIRVISISLGFNSNEKGYVEFSEAVSAARKENIQVISVSTVSRSGIEFMGVGKEPMSDANNFDAYRPGLFWQENADFVLNRARNILIPMDFRCTASPTGQEDYAVYINGGMSWAVPYIAGAYALACQTDPEITYDKFCDIAYATGETTMLKKLNGSEYKFERILNLQTLIEEIKQKNE